MSVRISEKNEIVVKSCLGEITLSIQAARALLVDLQCQTSLLESRIAKSEKAADEALLQALQAAVRKAHNMGDGFKDGDTGAYVPMPMCCSRRPLPSTTGATPGYWINTGRQTQLDGWRSRAEVDVYIANPQKLVDKAKW